NRKAPKTHDLVALFGIIEELHSNLSISTDALDNLNQVYIDARYPSDFGLLPGGLPSKDDIEAFYELAKNLFVQANHIVK
ncbi:MAG: HEPN domain-containing protein, partial [Spirochaetota bacterium]